MPGVTSLAVHGVRYLSLLLDQASFAAAPCARAPVFGRAAGAPRHDQEDPRLIDLVDVSKTFRTPGGEVHALDHVTLHVEPGEIFGIVGQSGAGKSTLIRTVNALEQPDSGTITVDGATISELRGAALRDARRRAGMIFQHFNLLSSRTALRH